MLRTESLLRKGIFWAAVLGCASPAFGRQAMVNGVITDTLDWRVPPSAPLVLDRTKINTKIVPSILQAPSLQLNARESELQVDSGPQASETFSATSLEPSAPPTVFAIYDLYAGTLRVDLFRTEKMGRSAQLVQAQFSPMHGSQWKSQGSFKDAMGASVDPFAQWQNPAAAPDRTGTNPNAPGNLFYNISPAGAQVVVSMAMQLVKSPTGILGISNVKTTRTDQQMPLTPLAQSGSSLYNYQSLQYVEWFSILPASLSAGGKTVWVCANGALPSNCMDTLKMPSLTKLHKMQGNYAGLGTRSPLGGDCMQGAVSPCTNTMAYASDTIKSWPTAAVNHLMADTTQSLRYPVLKAYLEMGARGRVGQTAIAAPAQKTVEALFMGKTKPAGLSQDSESAANSKDLAYGALAQAPTGLVVNTNPAVDLSAQNSQAGVSMGNALAGPPQTAALGAIPYFLQESLLTDEYDTLKQTRKMLGTFNTQNPNAEVSTGQYQASQGQTAAPSTQVGTVQNQTQTNSNKGLAIRQQQSVR